MKSTLTILFMLLVPSFALADVDMPEAKWAKFEDNKVRYIDVHKHKSNEAIIFIHGWACNAEFWHESINAFPEFRVIAIDLPGHGGSDKPKADYSMVYFARSIDAVMKKAGVKKAVLVGHSMGTPVIRQFYRLYPQRTLGLIVVDGGLRAYGTQEEMQKHIAPLGANYSENGPQFIDEMLRPVKDIRISAFVRKSMLATPDYVATSAIAGMIDKRIWTDDKINVPVLAIMAHSPYWRPETQQDYGAIAPNLEFQVWKGVSHFLMIERPQAFNEQVRGFILKNKLLKVYREKEPFLSFYAAK